MSKNLNRFMLTSIIPPTNQRELIGIARHFSGSTLRKRNTSY
jgi:hypothetical protein